VIPTISRLAALFLLALLPAGAESDSSPAAPAEPAPATESTPQPAETPIPDAETPLPPPAKVIVIPIREQIAKPELYILRRGLKQAIDSGIDTIILDMKTPGGSVAVTLEMMEALDRFEGRKITFVNDEAMSAGAIIAAVTDEIHFTPQAVIGAAEMILGSGQDVGEGLKRKYNSYLGAKIRAFTEEKPLRAQVIRAMMDPDYEFQIGEETIKPEGELLSLTAKEAIRQYGDPPQPLLGAGISPTLDELIESRFGPGMEIVRLEITWSEKLAQYITALTPLLMAAGLVLIFIEFKTPGFGIFGILGGLLMGTVFFGHHAAGLSGHEPALFFVLGVALVAVELFLLPGTFFFAITGGALMLGSLVWSMADLWPEEPLQWSGDVFLMPLVNVFAGVILAFLLMIALLRFLPRGGFWSHMVLDAAIASTAQGPTPQLGAEALQDSASLIGRHGLAITALFPAGQVEIDGRRYEASLAVGSAHPGTAIRCTGVGEFGIQVETLS
jgi:membrane-bound serine protease (ClpP class)